MRASIIVPAYNAELTLARCLAALGSQTIPREEYEIIVVDDGSTDATAQLAASFRLVRCISVVRGGAAAARNRGAAAAASPILLFTDADCAPQSDWIEKMLAPFEDPAVVGAKGTYRTRQRERVARFVQLEYEEKYARMNRAATIDFIDTYSAAYRRDIYLANGGFDESFPTASVEDQEFSFRLAELGHKMLFAPEAIVLHEHDITIATYGRRKFWIGYWKVRVHTRHPRKLWRDSHTPPTQKLQTVLFLVILASLAAIPFAALAAAILEIALFVFVISALPLVVFAARRDKAIGWIAPAMILLRAAALGLGLVTGVIGELGGRWVLKNPGGKDIFQLR